MPVYSSGISFISIFIILKQKTLFVTLIKSSSFKIYESFLSNIFSIGSGSLSSPKPKIIKPDLNSFSFL